MIKRRLTKLISIGGVIIGGGAPVVVQSMTKTDTRDIQSTVDEIHRLEQCGCEIVRIAIPDEEAAGALKEIKKLTRLPIVADIHFDYRLAIKALEAGIDGLRINPGNIGKRDRKESIIKKAKQLGIPIRIGINAGSLPKGIAGGTLSDRMVNAALAEISLMESLGFDLIKISLKAFDVPATIEAFRQISLKTTYPLHLGITEAGLVLPGSIRSAVGLGILLYEGIGDTIRVSLTDKPETEVYTAYEILKSLNLRQKGAILVSCPTCGRCNVDLVSIAKEVSNFLKDIDKPIKVAVMGCAVNGPGEAKDADIGIACGKSNGILFKKGVILKSLGKDEFLTGLKQEVNQILLEG